MCSTLICLSERYQYDPETQELHDSARGIIHSPQFASRLPEFHTASGYFRVTRTVNLRTITYTLEVSEWKPVASVDVNA